MREQEWEYKNTRAQGHKSMRVWGHKSKSVQQHMNVRAQECKSMRAQWHKNNVLVSPVIKNSLSFCFSLSLSFPYYLHAELWIVILEVWRFIIWQVNNNATLLHLWIKNRPFSCKKSAELRISSICTRNCCWIKNCQTSKCRWFVIHQITQTQTETEPEAVRSHSHYHLWVQIIWMNSITAGPHYLLS